MAPKTRRIVRSAGNAKRNENIVTIALVIWSAILPLVGVLVGAYVTNRNQRRQWLSNCKKEEYSELLSVVTKSVMIYLDLFAKPLPPAEQRRAETNALTRVAEIAQNRIFAAPAVKRLDLVKRWNGAARDLGDDGDIEKFTGIAAKLLKEIRNAAIEDIEA